MKRLPSPQLFCINAILSLFLLFPTACDKGDPVPATSETAFPCLLLTEEKSTTGYYANVSTATMEYDAKELIKSVAHTYSDEPDQVIVYERNGDGKISKAVIMRGTTVLYQTVMEYDPQGKWVKHTTGATGEVVILVGFSYDSKGMITKTVTATKNSQSTSTISKTFEYTNGNLSKMVYTDEERGFSDHHVYEYYLDKPSLMVEYDKMRSVVGGGSPSKNLVKRVTITRPTEPGFINVRDFTYELDEKGLPTLETETSFYSYGGSPYKHVGDTVIIARSYSCK